MSWLRGLRGTSLAVAVLAVTSVLSVGLAWASYHHGESLRGQRDDAQQAQVDHDIGFCTSIGDIWRQTGNADINVNLGSYRSLDPSIKPALSREARSLDQVGDNFPGADYRLVRASRKVADLSVATRDSPTADAYVDAVGGRSAAWAALEERCGYPPSVAARDRE